MNILKEKIFILLILHSSFFVIGCTNVTKIDADKIVIKIGDFNVIQQQFVNELKKLIMLHKEMTQEEASLFLLDNFISTGLLVESAKKMNFMLQKEFIKKEKIQNELLFIKYSKYLRANVGRVHHTDKQLIDDMLTNDIVIDYIRIPKESKYFTVLMFYYLSRSGWGISEDITNNPERVPDDSKGLSFYENVSLNNIILPKKVLKDIISEQNKKVIIVKEKSADYVVRILHSTENNLIKEDEESLRLNQLMAECIENGDIIFDPYRLKKCIKCNEALLLKIDFSITPFLNSESFVAKIGERFISESEIKEKISELPIKIQSLFVNKSTRIRAISSLLLLNHRPEKTSDWLQPNKISGYHQLSLNFGIIENMEINQKNIDDNQVIAYSDNWRMTVMDLVNELNKLSPITRLDISSNNLLYQLIEYLAKQNHKSHSQLNINSTLFNSIDIMGNSYDQLNYIFEEKDIVGTLENVDISVDELRKLVENLSESEKEKFMDITTRKEIFIELMIKKFWLNLYDPKIIEAIKGFQMEKTLLRNNLLADFFYETEIKSEEKMDAFLQKTMQDYLISINYKFFKEKYKLKIESSKYNKMLKRVNL